MKYIIVEINSEDGARFTAGVKARDDIETISKTNGYTLIEVKVEDSNRKNGSFIYKLNSHRSVMNEWKKATIHLTQGDELLIQFPVLNHSLLLYKAIRELKQRNVKITFFIHDLEMFRAALRKDNSIRKKLRLKFEEKSLLELGDKIIIHNDKMKNALATMGFPEKKMQVLEIFDYLIPNYEKKINLDSYNINNPIIIAGALRYHKAKYIYNLPKNVNFNLYGVGYDGKEQKNINYFGAFQPDDLPFYLKGSFGLVWDGESCETCNGVYGEYLKINNPHKTSLYLASGIPVIIWSKAALADFVKNNQCGLVIDSLDQIDKILREIDEEKYTKILMNASIVGRKLRSGYYTSKCI